MVLFIDRLKNELREAVFLRRDGKITEARAKLFIACEKKDPLALFYLGYAHEYGGFGIDYTIRDHAFLYYKQSARLGNVWAMARLLINNALTEESWSEKFYLQIIESNDAYALGTCLKYGCYNFAKDKGEALRLLQQAANDDNPFAQVEYVEYLRWDGALSDEDLIYLKTSFLWGNEYATTLSFSYSINDALLIGVKQSVRSCLKFFAKSDSNSLLAAECMLRLVPVECSYSDIDKRFADNKNALYLFGKAFSTNPVLKSVHKPYTDNSKSVYCASNFACQKAVIQWLLLKLLSRDTRRIIGEIIWQSRTNAVIWI